MTTRFVYGPHIFRDGQPVVEVYDGDKFVAAIYAAEHGIKVVSRHFAGDAVATYDARFPPALHVRFTGAEPAGRERMGITDTPPRPGFDEEDR